MRHSVVSKAHGRALHTNAAGGVAGNHDVCGTAEAIALLKLLQNYSMTTSQHQRMSTAGMLRQTTHWHQ